MRQALAWPALAAAVVLLGCGSDGDSAAEISEAAAADLTNKLDEILERVDRMDCPAADEALASLSAAVPEIDANQEFKDDFGTLLTDLDEQIAGQCSEDEAATTATTDETDDTDESSSTSSTTTTDETTVTDETTTTDDEVEEPEEETSVPEEPTVPETPGSSPVTPPGQGGDPGSGGIAPGFEAGRKGIEQP